jgi:hypothetical protein
MSTSRTREKADGELFKSTGIDDNATSTAVTIDASENVGIGTASPLNALQIGSANPITMNGNYPDIHFNGYYAAPHYRAVTTGYSTRMAFNPSNGSLSFKVGSNSTSAGANYNPIERVTLDKDGHLLVGDGITLGNGQTYAAANTLSDYEEGTFVATLRGSVSDPSTAATTTSMYRKIGETVYIQIAFENWNTAGASGQIQVTGLPFTSSPTGRFFISNSFYEGASWPSSGVPTAYVEANGTRIQCFTIRSSDAWTDTSHNASGSTYFWFAGTYPTGA